MSPAQFHHREAFVPADKDLSIFYVQKRRPRCRSPPPVSEFQTKFRNSEDKTMAYNKASEERKWRLWKEAEEKQLRELGVSEDRMSAGFSLTIRCSAICRKKRQSLICRA